MYSNNPNEEHVCDLTGASPEGTGRLHDTDQTLVPVPITVPSNLKHPPLQG